jgi:hypothetical protein
MAEHELQNLIIEYLQAKGIYCWRSNVGRKKNMHFGKKGSADITGITKDGRRLEVEVKDENGKQSEEQVKFQQAIDENKGIYILAKSLDDVIKVI